MDRITHEIRAQEWFRTIQACNDSGLSKRQWCEENGISIRKFYYWQRKIRKRLYNGTQIKETGLVSANPSEDAAPVTPSFAEIKATPVARSQSSQFQPDAVILVGDISIQIANTATSELMERIGKTLLHHAV